jgi:hypothetical protein
MQRAATKLLAFMALAMAFVTGVHGVTARQAVSIDSGALGLFPREVEAIFGPPAERIDVPDPEYGDTWAYETEDGTLIVTYREINGEDIAIYVEFNWRGDGVGEVDARNLVESLLPADAELTELYTAPPTTSGQIALVSNRYESAALGSNMALTPEILVMYQESWSANNPPSVHAVSISMRERTQATDS